ncbi:hypothetical protein HRbin11_01322 [bacterium HR11]|nr:hypothetical protein HRbin11_01322 [bacterium HR11]
MRVRVWVTLSVLILLARPLPAGVGGVRLDHIEVSHIATRWERDQGRDHLEVQKVQNASELGCPTLQEGYLVAVVEGIAFIVATGSIPYEPKTKLADHFAMHTPRGDVLYSAYFSVEDDRLYATAVRATRTQDGCTVLKDWDQVIRHLGLQGPARRAV